MLLYWVGFQYRNVTHLCENPKADLLRSLLSPLSGTIWSTWVLSHSMVGKQYSVRILAGATSEGDHGNQVRLDA